MGQVKYNKRQYNHCFITIREKPCYYSKQKGRLNGRYEFYHSEYDSLKKVRSIWLCLNNSEDGDSIKEIRLSRNAVFGK